MEPDELDADALHLEALEAEQEAIAAEAVATAARARARAARLRRRAADADRPAITTVNAAPADDDASAPPITPTDPVTPPATAEISDPGGADDPAAEPGRSDEATSAEPRETSSTDGAGSRRGWWRIAVAAAAAVLLVAGLGGSGYITWHHRQTTDTTAEAAEFTEAAKQGVVALTSLDFSRADADVHRVLDHSTGAFRSDFQGRAADFTTVIQQSKVATEGRVTAAAMESMTGDSAVVLVSATSQVTNSAGAKQEPRTWRLSVTVTREGDTIKMSKVEFVP